MTLPSTPSRYGGQTPEQLRDSFRRDGFVALPGFLRRDEVDLLLVNIARYVAEVAPTAAAVDVNFEDKTLPETLKQLHKLHRYDPFFAQVYNDGPFKRLAADLMGEEVVGNNCQYFNKAPGASLPTPPHQDGFYWQLTPCEGLTMWLALDDVDQENGCVRYVRGSHLRGLREHAASGVLGFSQQMSDFGRPEDLKHEVAMPARPGDLLVHHALTIHRADGNCSADRQRRSMGFIYYAASAREDTAAKEAYQERLREELQAAGKI